ncbi:MAG: TRAP transporter substrate-binding protein [Alphaproteobacteria bacterium]
MKLSKSIALGAIAAIALPAAAATAADLKIASFPGPKHPINARLFTPWLNSVNAMNKGLNVKLFVAGKLGKGPAKQFKRAVDGVADISFGLQGYTSKQFRATTLVELANVMTNAADGTKRLQAAYAKSEAVRNEYEKVHVLGIWTIDVPIIMTKNKAIKSVADLKGLKLRTPSQMSARSIRALGAVPVPMPITKLYNALARGTVDGVLVSPTVLHTFKIKEVTRYFASGIPFGSSPMFIVMNKSSWNKLSPAHKDIINKTTGTQMGATGGNIYDTEHAKGMAFLAGSKSHNLIRLPDAEVRKATGMLNQLEREVVAEWEKQGVPATEILKIMRAAGA